MFAIIICIVFTLALLTLACLFTIEVLGDPGEYPLVVIIWIFFIIHIYMTFKIFVGLPL